MAESDVFPLTVGIVLFDDVEVLDFCGPFEVFAVTRPLAADAGPAGGAQQLFHVLTLAAPRAAPTGGSGETPAAADGRAAREVRNASLIEWLRAAAPATRHVTASVCTGAFLLAEAGLLDGRAATTHWSSLVRLRESYPGVRVAGVSAGEPVRPYGIRFVDEGRVVTSAGISAGIDMALHLVARLAGADVARQTAEQMEYRWTSAAGG